MTPSLEGQSTKAKEAPSPQQVRLTPLETNPVFHCLERTKEGTTNHPTSFNDKSTYQIFVI